jgi:hypothetical protein
VRNSSAEEKIWRASRPFLFGFTLFFSCVLASFAAAQTSASRLFGGSEQFGRVSELRSQSSKSTSPGKMLMNRNETLTSASAFFERDWASHPRPNLGAVTLSTNLGDPFAAAVTSGPVTQERSYALNADTNFSSFPAAATFPESALTEENVLGQEITPVSEPGTRIAAALAAAFLMWKRRKSLMAAFNAISATHARMRFAPDENVAQLTNLSTRAVSV